MPFSSRIRSIPLEQITLNPWHARSSIDEASIAGLAASIRRFGLLSPLLLRRSAAGAYELIAGERRLRALQQLGRDAASAIVLSAYDSDCALIALVENVERENLHFLDEASACRRILDEHGFLQEELAALLSRSPSTLANRLRLLKLSGETQRCIRDSGLSERHARALLRLNDAEKQLELAQQAASKKWSVRQLEAQVEAALQAPRPRISSPHIRDRRLVLNAFRNTLKSLNRLGIQASSRVEDREEGYEIIITIMSP